MNKSPINRKQALVLTALVLLAACTLTSVASNFVHAQEEGQQTSAYLVLTPSQAPVGSTVIVSGAGFSTSEATTISFNGKSVGSVQAGGWDGDIYLTFTVPNGASGSCTVTADDGAGDTATAQFTVGALTATSTPAGGSGASPTPYSGTGGTPTYTSPYYTLPPTQTSGGVSILLIALIAVIVAVAVVIPLGFFVMRGHPSKRDRLLEREPAPSPYAPQPSAPYGQPASPYNQPSPYSPTSSPHSSPYNRPSTPYSSSAPRYGSGSYSSSTSRPSMYDRYSPRGAPPPTSRYSSPASSQQSSAYGKTCPHCHRTVRGDYSICPYCNKRLR